MFNKIFNNIKKKLSDDYSIEKNCNWFIQVHVTENSLPSNLSSIEVLCFEADKILPVKDLDFSWYREIENRSYKLNSDNSFYDFSGFDIGTKIKLSIKQKDTDNAAIITFNKIVLDFNLRFNLELILAHNETNFQVNLNNDITKSLDICSKIKMDKDHMKFIIEDKELIFKFNEIGLESVYENYKKLLIYIDLEKYDKETKTIIKKFLPLFEKNDIYYCYLKFINRESKDTFIISYKLINNIKLLNFNQIFKKLESVSEKGTIFENDSSISIAELLLYQDNLREVFKKMIKFNKNVISEKDSMETYVESLEKDIQLTIKEFKDIINNLKKSNKIDNNLLNQSQILLDERSAYISSRLNKNSLKKPDNQIEDINKLKSEIKNLKNVNSVLLKEIKKNKIEINSRIAENTFNLTKFEKENKSILKDISQISLQTDNENKKILSNLNTSNINLLENENNKLKIKVKELENKLVTLKSSDSLNIKGDVKELREVLNSILTGSNKSNNIDNNKYLSKDLINSIKNSSDKNKLEIWNIENNTIYKQLNLWKKENQILRKSIKSQKVKLENSIINNTMINNSKSKLNDYNSVLINKKDMEKLNKLEIDLENEKLKNNNLKNVNLNLAKENQKLINNESKLQNLMAENEDLSNKLNVIN